MKLKIIRTSGPDTAGDAGYRLLERGTLTLGRGAECDWPLPDPERTLSKLHCELAFQGNVYVLRDTSTNGVFVNDAARPLGRGRTVVLKHGDRFRAADFAFRVELVADAATDPLDAVAPAAPASPPRPRQADPGSPLDPGEFRGVRDPFDAFSVADTGWSEGRHFPPLETDPADWGRDPGAEGSFSAGDFGSGFGAMDFADPPTGALIPDDFDLAPPEPSFPAAPWDDAPSGATAGHADDALAGPLLEALLQLDRQLEEIALRLGIATPRPGAADRLPPASGPGLIAHLHSLTEAERREIVAALGREMVSRAAQIAQTLEARPANPAGGISPFEEDPFG